MVRNGQQPVRAVKQPAAVEVCFEPLLPHGQWFRMSLLVQPREGRGLQGGTKSRAVAAISHARQFNVMVIAPIPAGTVEARRFSQPELMNMGTNWARIRLDQLQQSRIRGP